MLDHFNPNDTTKDGKPRKAEADSLGYSNRRIERGNDKKPLIQGNTLGSRNERWGKKKRLKDFKEKGLKKR